MDSVINLKRNQSKSRTTTFRVLFIILIIGMLGGGITQLLRIDYQVAQFLRLGYPMYLLSIIGTAKILAALVLMIHRWPLLTVAAYVGTFIVSVCAFLSHLISGDAIFIVLNPLILTAITLACCYLDPTIKFVKD